MTSGATSAGSMVAMYDGSPATSDTTGLKQYAMGVLVYSVVAHSGLFPGSNVTSATLSQLFVSPGVHGKVAVGRLGGSGSRQAFKKVLGRNPGTPSGNCPSPTGQPVAFTGCTEGSTANVLNFVNQTPNAIGYAEVFGSLVADPDVSVLYIDNAAPTAATEPEVRGSGHDRGSGADQAPAAARDRGTFPLLSSQNAARNGAPGGTVGQARLYSPPMAHDPG